MLMNKEIKVLGYDNSANLGDHIQSLAAIHTLKRLGFKHAGFIDRDNPQEPTKTFKRTNLLINAFIRDGSFDIKSKGINLIYSNLHIDSENKDFLAERIDAISKYQPIGCRDRHTTNLLKQAGVGAFFNYCLTLMFDRRKIAPVNGKTFLVDVSKYVNLPRKVKNNANYIKHEDHRHLSFTDKIALAQKLLDTYREEAKLVITSRLHCALPCIAMGVPVILLGTHDPHRLALAEEFIPIHKIHSLTWAGSVNNLFALSVMKRTYSQLMQYTRTSLYYHNNEIDWNPEPIDIGDIQEKVLTQTKEQILRFI